MFLTPPIDYMRKIWAEKDTEELERLHEELFSAAYIKDPIPWYWSVLAFVSFLVCSITLMGLLGQGGKVGTYTLIMVFSFGILLYYRHVEKKAMKQRDTNIEMVRQIADELFSRKDPETQAMLRRHF